MRNELLLQKYDNEIPYAWHAYHMAFCGGTVMTHIIGTEINKSVLEDKISKSEYANDKQNTRICQVTEAAYRKFKTAKSHQCFNTKLLDNGIILYFLNPKM